MKQNAEDDIKKAYEDGFNIVANVFLDLPAVMTGLEDMFFDNTIEQNQDNINWYVNQASYQNDERDKAVHYRDDVYNFYNKARSVYAENFDNYKLASRVSDARTIESLILETYETTKIISDVVKTSNNFIDFIQDIMEQHDFFIPSMVSTHQSGLDSYTKIINSHLLNLLSIKNTIQTSKETIVNSERSIAEKIESLAKLKAGADSLDIQLSELTIKQRENAFLDAKEKLNDYFVRALFDGIIANFDAKKGDSVSSAAILGALITKQKIAEISLNEVDVVKVKIGQKATLIFDAIPEFVITGQVAETDIIGTVSQGVVTYIVKIVFDAQDDRIKSGMSVSASIITETKSDILLVPNSAIKQRGEINYVEMPQNSDLIAATDKNKNGAKIAGIILKNSLRRQQIEVEISNDEFTEIISGLKQGDVIITRTIQTIPSKISSQTQQQSNGLKIPGINTGTTGGFKR